MRYVKTFLRVLLGVFMTYAGISHLTVARQEFLAQVPSWFPQDPGFQDFVVLASGVVEIALGIGMILLYKYKGVVGVLLALFYVIIFPGNISQYVERNQCVWPRYGSSSVDSPVLSAGAHCVRSLVYGWRGSNQGMDFSISIL